MLEVSFLLSLFCSNTILDPRMRQEENTNRSSHCFGTRSVIFGKPYFAIANPVIQSLQTNESNNQYNNWYNLPLMRKEKRGSFVQ